MLRLFPPPHLAEQAQMLAKKNPDATGLAFATSGTSGEPKWVLHSQKSLDWCGRTINQHFDSSSKDVWGLALPDFHVGGFCLAHRAQLAKGTLAKFPHKWDADAFHQWLVSEKVTLTSLVPTQIFDLISLQKKAPPTLRIALVGGEHLADPLFEQALALGWPLVVSYGMTETAGLIAASEVGQKKLHPLSGWELATNQEGLLTVAGPGLFQGHLTDSGFQAIEPPFATKDLVELSADSLIIHGRSDDQVKVLGELVDLAQLRKSLAKALPHHRATILALPHPRRNFLLFPIIESLPTNELEHSIANWNSTLPAFSRCQPPFFLSSWPRTPLGKLDYQALSQQMINEQDSLLPKTKKPA